MHAIGPKVVLIFVLGALSCRLVACLSFPRKVAHPAAELRRGGSFRQPHYLGTRLPDGIPSFNAGRSASKPLQSSSTERWRPHSLVSVGGVKV